MKNFLLSARKADIRPFGLLPETVDLDWIESNIGYGSPGIETPAGTKDGVNVNFTVSSTLFLNSVIYKNGVALHEDEGDYTLVGSALTFTEAPLSDDTIVFWGWLS